MVLNPAFFAFVSRFIHIESSMRDCSSPPPKHFRSYITTKECELGPVLMSVCDLTTLWSRSGPTERPWGTPVFCCHISASPRQTLYQPDQCVCMCVWRLKEAPVPLTKSAPRRLSSACRDRGGGRFMQAAPQWDQACKCWEGINL